MELLQEIWKFVKPFIPFLGGYEAITDPPDGSEVDDYRQCQVDCSGSYEEDRIEEQECVKCCQDIIWSAIGWLAAQMGINFVIGGIALGIAIGKILEALAKKLLGGAVPVVGWVLFLGELANFIALGVVAYWVWTSYQAATQRFCKCE